MSPLTWPDGLTPQTPLPYSMWRVMDAVDGKRDVAAVAAQTGLPEAEVVSVQAQVTRLVQRVTARTQPLTDELEKRVTQCLVSVVGPMASVMIDEVFEDLGDTLTLDDVLGHLRTQLSPAQTEQFTRQLQVQGVT